VESKEAVAGFFVIEAASLEATVEIADGCPGLDVGQTVEVRGLTTDPFENEIAQIDAAQKDDPFGLERKETSFKK
jgi:hypothetical protein